MKEALFIIDLANCVGCYACAIACKDRAGLPDALDWLHVEKIESGRYPHPKLTYRVTHCFHCAQASCVQACPTGALTQRDDGLVALDAATCSGCGRCLEACPFSAIVMLPEGVASKCDACADELALGWDPTCVRACPMRALSYGPLGQNWLAHRQHDSAFDDHGMAPRVAYLRRLDLHD